MCKIEHGLSVVPSSNATFPSSIIRNKRQEVSITSDQAAMLQKMRDTKVFRVCAGFLDGKSTAEAVMRLV